MTCIIAIKNPDDNSILLAADSRGSNNSFCTTRADSKLFKKLIPLCSGDMYQYLPLGIAFTSSYRMGQIIKYHLDCPRFDRDIDNSYDYVARSLIPEIRGILTKHAYTTIKDNVEKGGNFILTLQGRIFNIGSDFQVAEHPYPYFAEGGGDKLALGALFATYDASYINTKTIQQTAITALCAAQEFCPHVREPWVFLTIDGDVEQ